MAQVCADPTASVFVNTVVLEGCASGNPVHVQVLLQVHTVVQVLVYHMSQSTVTQVAVGAFVTTATIHVLAVGSVMSNHDAVRRDSTSCMGV